MYSNMKGSLDSPLNSTSSSGSISTEETRPTVYRGRNPAMKGTNQDTPFPLKVLSRSPNEILEKKAEMKKIYMNIDDDVDEAHKLIEKEVADKLYCLEKIQKLKEGSGPYHQQDEYVMLSKLQDLEQKKEIAWRMIKKGEEEIADLKLQQLVAQQNLLTLKMSRTSNKQLQAHTETLLQAKLVSLQSQLYQVDNNQSHEVQSVQLGTCVQFSNLNCLSGQLAQLCMGEMGCKWVIERLMKGGPEERSMVRTELNLPSDLLKHFTSPACREVILVLTEVDSLARNQILCQTSIDIDKILSMEGGHQFVTKLLRGFKD